MMGIEGRRRSRVKEEGRNLVIDNELDDDNIGDGEADERINARRRQFAMNPLRE